MDFIEPMYASPYPKDFNPKPGEWVAEQKFDGHRLIVGVSDKPSTLFDNRTIAAWSRNGLPRVLPTHVREALAELPVGMYDGELLVPGKRSYGVTELTEQKNLVYTMFDILSMMGRNLRGNTYDDRRQVMNTLFNNLNFKLKPGLIQAWAQVINDGAREIDLMAQQVWDEDGEGLILKRRASLYHPGKRPKDWIKIKKLRSDVLTIVGYVPGRMGPHSTVLLQNSSGLEVTVKAKNDLRRAALDANPEAFIGRRLRIEFQERTPDGSYRHPRWDRFEDE